MPIDLQLTATLIRIVFQGDVTAEELRQHARELGRLEGTTEAALPRFTDLSGATDLPQFVPMADFAAQRTEAALKNRVRSAVYAPRDFQFGVARMFEKLNANPHIELRVFSDKAEALAWVGAEGENAAG